MCYKNTSTSQRDKHETRQFATINGEFRQILCVALDSFRYGGFFTIATVLYQDVLAAIFNDCHP